MSKLIFRSMTCMILGYLIGILNPAFAISKMRGFDIRERGSGNAGASNAVLTMGKSVGLFVALFDITKAYCAVRLARHFFPSLTYAAELAGIFTILGHMFPITMQFRGGKGLACLGGMVLAFDAQVFWIMFLCELALVFIVDYIFVVPLTASAAFPFVYYFITGQLLGSFLYAAMFPVFLYKHLDNIRRLRKGMEVRVSYLWNREKETERVTRAMNGK